MGRSIACSFTIGTLTLATINRAHRIESAMNIAEPVSRGLQAVRAVIDLAAGVADTHTVHDACGKASCADISKEYHNVWSGTHHMWHRPQPDHRAPEFSRSRRTRGPTPPGLSQSYVCSGPPTRQRCGPIVWPSGGYKDVNRRKSDVEEGHECRRHSKRSPRSSLKYRLAHRTRKGCKSSCNHRPRHYREKASQAPPNLTKEECALRESHLMSE